MKRIITFAIMALLIGGFTIHADAQAKPKPKTSSNDDATSTPQAKPDVVTGLLDDYQAAVDTCRKLDSDLLDLEKKLGVLEKKLDDMGKNAGESTRTKQKIDKTVNHSLNRRGQSKTELQKEIKELEIRISGLQKSFNYSYNEATRVQKKLVKLEDTMTASQQQRYKIITSTFNKIHRKSTSTPSKDKGSSNHGSLKKRS